ncbi:hypothetical protein [Mesorhizobium sp. 1B3]
MTGIPALDHLRCAYAATPQAAVVVIATGRNVSPADFSEHVADA